MSRKASFSLKGKEWLYDIDTYIVYSHEKKGCKEKNLVAKREALFRDRSMSEKRRVSQGKNTETTRKPFSRKTFFAFPRFDGCIPPLAETQKTYAQLGWKCCLLESLNPFQKFLHQIRSVGSA